MVAVRLGVLGFQVAVFIGQYLPQVEEDAVLLQRDGRQLIVDLAQPLLVQAGVLFPHFGPDRGDGLDIESGVGQRLGDHIQHQAVIGQKAAVIVVPVEDVGAQQNVQRPGLLGGQNIHGDLCHTVGPLAGGAIDHGVGAHAFISTEMRVGQAVFIHLHPLGQAVAQEPHVRKPAAVHGLRGGLRRQPEIHGRGAVGLGLDAQAAGRLLYAPYGKKPFGSLCSRYTDND